MPRGREDEMDAPLIFSLLPPHKTLHIQTFDIASFMPSVNVLLKWNILNTDKATVQFPFLHTLFPTLWALTGKGKKAHQNGSICIEERGSDGSFYGNLVLYMSSTDYCSSCVQIYNSDMVEHQEINITRIAIKLFRGL